MQHQVDVIKLDVSCHRVCCYIVGNLQLFEQTVVYVIQHAFAITETAADECIGSVLIASDLTCWRWKSLEEAWCEP